MPFEQPDTIAAIQLDKVTGTDGVIILSAGFLKRVRALWDRQGVIYDELMSGFGRTVKWRAVVHWDALPDIFTAAKGLASGDVPLRAAAMRQEIVLFLIGAKLRTDCPIIVIHMAQLRKQR